MADETSSDKKDEHAKAVKRYTYAYEACRDNMLAAYEDLEFAAGDQWPANASALRKASDRPVLTVNMVPKFTRQVTGDIRQLRPAIRVYGVDDKADIKTAETFQDVIRYIERRSDATYAYFHAVDSLVASGYGAWRVETEESDTLEGVQEIRISPVRDCLSVVIDPDSDHHTRLDARFAFVPVDFTYEAFKEKFPDAKVSEFDSLDAWVKNIAGDAVFGTGIPWYTDNTVRVLEYFFREKDGKVYRYLMTAAEILEGPREIPCPYIPIVPIHGEEIVLGGKTVRRGLVRHMMDGQRLYNYMLSSQAEIVALQPKAPWLVTEENIERYQDVWRKAHSENVPFLPYAPDAKNGGAAPQRATPPVASPGVDLLVSRAAETLKDVTGIYDASLGARSNEQSGKAILARQREGDTGTFHFVDAFTRGLRLTGQILVAMIPRIYDTARILRVIGEDGQVNEVHINRPVEKDGFEQVFDLTVGKYDVTVESGPSYTTKRDEAREGMAQMMQSAPQIVPLVADLFAASQDWPQKEKIAKRLQAILPPEIKAQEEEETGDGKMPMAPQVPPPEVIAQQVAQEVMASLDAQVKQAEIALKAAQARKAEADAMKAEIEAQMAGMPQAPVEPQAPQQPDPVQQIELEAYKAQRLGEVQMGFEMQRKKLERNSAQASEMGMGEDAAQPVEPMGPTPVELLADAIMRQGQALQQGLSELGSGMQALAASQMAPTELVRDESGRPIGARKVMQ